ncbi:MAG: LamG-like jellyroll fold domain-containing protein [Myxococcota bacterium]
MNRSLWICGLALLGGAIGCAKDACKSQPTSFELDLSTGALGAAIHSVTIDLSIDSAHLEKTFEIAGQLDDGRTSLAVTIDQPPTSEFSLSVAVHAFSGTGGSGDLLASGDKQLRATPDGCNQFGLDLSPAANDAGVADAMTPADSGDDAGVDGGTVDGSLGMDAEPTDLEPADGAPDAGAMDAEPLDAPDPDAASPDAELPDLGPADAGSCLSELDPTTVALYEFDGNLTDSTTTAPHHGALNGNGTSFTPGTPACGQALRFASGPVVDGYGRIPDSQDFSLATGSIDFFVARPAAPPNRALTVLSRDSSGNVAGSLTVYLSCAGNVIVKLEAADGPHYRCSATAAPAGGWSHVGLNFGAPGLELYIDGTAANHVGALGLGGANCSSRVPCDGTTTGGIDGVREAWILGASNEASAAGTTNNLSLPLRGGAIDRLRISNARRAF